MIECTTIGAKRISLGFRATSLAGEMRRRAASYVDRVLRGAKPEDLPVQLSMHGAWTACKLQHVAANNLHASDFILT